MNDWTLLNWNPDRAAMPGVEDNIWTITGIGDKPPIRGTQFLIKRCKYNPAIVGYGVTIGSYFEDADFEDARKRSFYVPIKVISSSLEQVLPVKALKLLGINLPWEFQGAMCRIDPVMSERVRLLFDAMHVELLTVA
jgi:hypothetical protein